MPALLMIASGKLGALAIHRAIGSHLQGTGRRPLVGTGGWRSTFFRHNPANAKPARPLNDGLSRRVLKKMARKAASCSNGGPLLNGLISHPALGTAKKNLRLTALLHRKRMPLATTEIQPSAGCGDGCRAAAGAAASNSAVAGLASSGWLSSRSERGTLCGLFPAR
jgi:hypothetical protein